MKILFNPIKLELFFLIKKNYIYIKPDFLWASIDYEFMEVDLDHWISIQRFLIMNSCVYKYDTVKKTVLHNNKKKSCYQDIHIRLLLTHTYIYILIFLGFIEERTRRCHLPHQTNCFYLCFSDCEFPSITLIACFWKKKKDSLKAWNTFELSWNQESRIKNQ